MLEILEQVLDREMNWEEGRDAMEDAVFRSNHQHRDSSPLGGLMLQRDAGEAALPADKRQAPGTPSAPGLAPEQVIAAPPVADSAQGATAAAAAVAEAVALVEAAGRAAAAATVAAAITSRAAGTSSGPASAEQKPERSVIERLMHRLGGLFNLGGGLGKSEPPQSQPALPTSQSPLALLPKQRRALLAERGDWRAEAILANAKQAVASARRIQLEVEPDAPTYPAGPPIAMGTMEEYEELMHLMQLAEVATQGLGEDVQHEALRFALATFKNRCRYRELGRDPGRLPDNLTVRAEVTPAAGPPAAAGEPGQPPAAGLPAALAQALSEDIPRRQYLLRQSQRRQAGTGAGLLPSAGAGSYPAQAQLQGAPATGKAEAGAWATAAAGDDGKPEAGAQAQLQGLPATGKPEAGAQATAPVSDAGRPAPVQMPPGTPADERDPVTHQGPTAASEAQVVVEPQAVLVPPTASDEAPGSPQAAEQQLVPQPAPADASKALEGKSAVEAEPTVDHEPERPPPTAEPQADSVEAGLQPPVSQEPVAGEFASHVEGSKTHAGLSLGCSSQKYVGKLFRAARGHVGRSLELTGLPEHPAHARTHRLCAAMACLQARSVTWACNPTTQTSFHTPWLQALPQAKPAPVKQHSHPVASSARYTQSRKSLCGCRLGLLWSDPVGHPQSEAVI